MKEMRRATHSDGPLENTPPGSLQYRSRSFLLTAALLAAVGVAIYEGHQASRKGRQLQTAQQAQALLAERIHRLQQERDEAVKRLATQTPRLPAPPMEATAEPNAPSMEDLQSTNLYARFKDRAPKLTAEQVQAYLKENGRKAANLLAAYRTSGDPTLLTEAMQNYPNDPQVAFEAAFNKDLSPEARRQWLDNFKQSAPDNALANYLSARDFLKAGQPDQAIQELTAASGKPRFQDYTLERMQDDEEAYLAAGYPVAEAKLIGSSEVTLPQLAELKQLGLQMVDLSNAYRKAGDDASAEAVLQMAVNLGQRYDGASAGDCAISHLVGLVIERNALSAMDPNRLYGDSGHSVQEQLDRVMAQKAAISSFFKENERLLQTMSDLDWINYIDRAKGFGDEAALRWVVGKRGPK